MDASQLNPFIRYMDLRCGSISYSEPIKAYDYRLFAIREGECAAETETKRLTLRAGSCLIIPPDHAYRMLFHRDAPAMLYNINFSLSYLPGNGQAFRPDPPARFRPERMPELPDPAFFPIPTLFQDVPQIQQTAALLLSEREKRDVYFNELCSALLKGMLLQLMREPKAGEKPVPTVVERLKQYLEAHSRERITADSLGRMFGYHPFYLNRLFHKYAHQTIHLYQMQCRIRNACALLVTTDLSMKEIADNLGFSSPSHFSETFRKLRGVSPRDYRSGMRCPPRSFLPQTGASPKSGTSNACPSRIMDSCASSPGTVYLAASHALTVGIFSKYAAVQKSSTSSLWLAICPFGRPA